MIEYNVTMSRPDQIEDVTRKLFPTKPIRTVSARQLAGYLTHTIFGDYERGEAGTFYTVKERIGNTLNVFTIRRMEDGTYQHV